MHMVYLAGAGTWGLLCRSAGGRWWFAWWLSKHKEFIFIKFWGVSLIHLKICATYWLNKDVIDFICFKSMWSREHWSQI